jgi:energy-coupling factor transporter ATP-binding protein EcfA2
MTSDRTEPTGSEPDYAGFDQLVGALTRWSGSLPDWPPAAGVRSEWEGVEPRLERARRELSRMLVVGVVGGTGTGKSTLVNALAGADVTAAGDVARPTTTAPVIVAARDVDLSWLPLDAMGGRVVRSDAAAVANIVLVDCPDPDTQPGAAAGREGAPPRPSDSNHNRELLEAVLPACDVLLLVATAQKYRSWIVAREVQAFAPGRPLLFVQSHAARDPDIRADWRRELESQGFDVPRIFRLDGVEAVRRATAGLEPEPGFRELAAAIEEELVGRAARRVRRTGALDLAGWFTRQARGRLAPLREPVAQFAAGVDAERARLEGILARAVGGKLRASRAAWQRLVTDEVVDRWHGGPFATFLHVLAALGSFWTRVRPGGGVIGRLLAGQSPAAAAGSGGWQAVAELGLSEAEVEQSRSILAGLAARARVAEPLVGRARLDAARVPATAGALLERTGHWLAAGIDQLVAERRGRSGGPVLHWTFEVLFTGLFVAVIGRAGWKFFHDHLWLGRPMDGGGFLQEAVVWLILWGLFLRWVAFALVRSGLDRDITALVGRLPAAKLVDPLLADFADAASRTRAFLDDGERLGREADRVAATLDESAALGRLRGGGP